jgi:hypothetical protein
MLRRLALAASLALLPSLTSAQQALIAPTAPTTANNDQIANTAWVNNFVGAAMPLASGKIWIGSAGNIATPQTMSADATLSILGALTLATVNTNVGTFGSATQCPALTVNAKGLVTAASQATCTPAVGSITGLGTGVATALGNAVNVSGGIVTPTPTRAGDVPFWNGSAWTSLAGNNSGTNCLQENASGVPSWATCGGGGGTPGGSNTQVQYNNAGAFGGITGATTNGTALTLVAPVLGTPASATLTNATGLPIGTGVSGLGTGIATALGVNVGTAGAPVVNGGVLGSPSSAGTMPSFTNGGTITGGSHVALTGLGIRDTSAAFDVTLAATSSGALSAGRTLTLNMGNVAHTLGLGTTANTITFPNAASYNVLTDANLVTVAQGGLGIGSGTSGGVPYYSGSTTIASSGALTANTLVAGGGAGAAPKNSGLSVQGSDLSSLVATSAVTSLPQFALTNSVADANGPSFLFKKNRAATDTTTSDSMMDFQFYGWANAGQNFGARWQILQAAASSGSNIPTKMVWSTSTAGGIINQTMTFDQNAHLSFGQATAPTVSAGCNGAGSSVAGTDFAGTVTGQTAAATTCTVTFGVAFAATPHCVVTGLTSPLTGAVTPATGTLVVNFASTANYKFTYHCAGA